MNIPENVKASLDRYVMNGIPTGDFLRAVLSNDLFEAVGRADMDNQHNLVSICQYIYNYCPSTCHGSLKKVDEWIKNKMLEKGGME